MTFSLAMDDQVFACARSRWRFRSQTGCVVDAVRPSSAAVFGNRIRGNVPDDNGQAPAIVPHDRVDARLMPGKNKNMRLSKWPVPP